MYASGWRLTFVFKPVYFLLLFLSGTLHSRSGNSHFETAPHPFRLSSPSFVRVRTVRIVHCGRSSFSALTRTAVSLYRARSDRLRFTSRSSPRSSSFRLVELTSFVFVSPRGNASSRLIESHSRLRHLARLDFRFGRPSILTLYGTSSGCRRNIV